MFQYDDPLEDPNEPGGYRPPAPGGFDPFQPKRVPTQNDPDWTPPGPDWEYREGIGWRPKAGSPTAGAGDPPGGGGGMDEAAGRAYDAQRGLLGGYMGANGWVSGEPRSGGPPGPGQVSGQGGMSAYGGGGDYPNYESAGPFNPRRDSYDVKPFAYDAFAPSSWADAEKEPGYGASRDQLRQRVEAGAAHRGILRSGMTLGDIYTNLDALSQQNFSQFDDRRVRNYGVNRGNAFENWSANTSGERNKFLDEYSIDKDRHSFQTTEIDRKNNYGFNVADAKSRDALSRWQEQVRSLTTLGRPI